MEYTDTYVFPCGSGHLTLLEQIHVTDLQVEVWCTFKYRETSVCWKANLSFVQTRLYVKAIHYTDIFENRVQNKGQALLCHAGHAEQRVTHRNFSPSV